LSAFIFIYFFLTFQRIFFSFPFLLLSSIIEKIYRYNSTARFCSLAVASSSSSPLSLCISLLSSYLPALLFSCPFFSSYPPSFSLKSFAFKSETNFSEMFSVTLRSLFSTSSFLCFTSFRKAFATAFAMLTEKQRENKCYDEKEMREKLRSWRNICPHRGSLQVISPEFHAWPSSPPREAASSQVRT